HPVLKDRVKHRRPCQWIDRPFLSVSVDAEKSNPNDVRLVAAASDGECVACERPIVELRHSRKGIDRDHVQQEERDGVAARMASHEANSEAEKKEKKE